jgi:hypothetical protein
MSGPAPDTTKLIARKCAFSWQTMGYAVIVLARTLPLWSSTAVTANRSVYCTGKGSSPMNEIIK